MKILKKIKTSKWLRWQTGRQGTGYDKMLLALNHKLIPFDCYLLRFPEGVSIPPHRDQVTTGKHYRLNMIVKTSDSGGEFICEQNILNLPRIKLFRPDIYVHQVTEVKGGSRWVLSIGWVLGQQNK